MFLRLILFLLEDYLFLQGCLFSNRLVFYVFLCAPCRKVPSLFLGLRAVFFKLLQISLSLPYESCACRRATHVHDYVRFDARVKFFFCPVLLSFFHSPTLFLICLSPLQFEVCPFFGFHSEFSLPPELFFKDHIDHPTFGVQLASPQNLFLGRARKPCQTSSMRINFYFHLSGDVLRPQFPCGSSFVFENPSSSPFSPIRLALIYTFCQRVMPQFPLPTICVFRSVSASLLPKSYFFPSLSPLFFPFLNITRILRDVLFLSRPDPLPCNISCRLTGQKRPPTLEVCPSFVPQRRRSGLDRTSFSSLSSSCVFCSPPPPLCVPLCPHFSPKPPLVLHLLYKFLVRVDFQTPFVLLAPLFSKS